MTIYAKNLHSHTTTKPQAVKHNHSKNIKSTPSHPTMV